jgi:pyrimidine operon attenuation protein/uracil phosphoribosyltransferase
MSCSRIWHVFRCQDLLTTAIDKFSDKYGERKVGRVAEEILERYSRLKDSYRYLIENRGEILKRIESKLKKRFGVKYG